MKEAIKYIDGDIQRILDTEDFLSNEYKYLAKKIKKFREINGLSVREMAAKVGCSGMKISHIEREIYRPNKDDLLKLIYVLNEN